MTIHPNAVLRLFWRHHRQTYVPLTRSEIHTRLKADPDEINTILRGLTRDGLLTHNGGTRANDTKHMIYDATEAGMAAHREIMMMGAGS